MPKLDQFESVFKSADKAVFTYAPLNTHKVLVATDLNGEDAAALVARTKRFLSHLGDQSGGLEFQVLTDDSFSNVGELLQRIEDMRPDLIVTYRNLKSDSWKWPFGLGEYLEVLMQAIETPVLVLPHPDAGHALPHSVMDTDRVMAMTDNLAGDDRLVNTAFAFTADGGTCWLAHVENADSFERYMTAISKIAEIDTDTARSTIAERLQKEPREYIEGCRTAAGALDLKFAVEAIVAQGHHVTEYKRLIEEHEIDLLVLYTKDDDHHGMHGVAYPLAVEMRQIPLLML